MKEAELDWAVVFMDEEVILFQNNNQLERLEPQSTNNR